jgi:phage tail-like protein
MANPGKRKEAFPAFHFEVDIGGVAYPFRSVSGLKSETKVVDVEEGGVNTHVHKLIGQTTFPPLVMRMGFCDPASDLYKLYLSLQTSGHGGQGVKRFDGFVRQIGPNGTSAKWVFKKAWIAKWEGPELDATKNEVSIESIEIMHEGCYLVGGGGGASSGKGSNWTAGLSIASGLFKGK